MGATPAGEPVDGDFSFAEGGVAAAEEFAGNIVGDAGVPEFVVVLALGEDVEIGVLNVGGQGEGAGERVGGGVESDGAAGGSGRESQDLIGGDGAVCPLASG